jgi:hypothetical protein
VLAAKIRWSAIFSLVSRRISLALIATASQRWSEEATLGALSVRQSVAAWSRRIESRRKNLHNVRGSCFMVRATPDAS